MQCALRPDEIGPTDSEAFPGKRLPCDGRLNAREAYTRKIACMPWICLGSAGVVDGVVLSRVEDCDACRHLRLRKPTHSRIKVPSRFRFEVWIAERRGIAVIEIEEGGDAKAMANGGVQ